LVRNLRDGSRCLHVTARFATLAAGTERKLVLIRRHRRKSLVRPGKSPRSQPDRTLSIAVSTWLLIGYFIAIPCKRKVVVGTGKASAERRN
jgi:hypothetical protein